MQGRKCFPLKPPAVKNSLCPTDRLTIHVISMDIHAKVYPEKFPKQRGSSGKKKLTGVIQLLSKCSVFSFTSGKAAPEYKQKKIQIGNLLPNNYYVHSYSIS